MSRKKNRKKGKENVKRFESKGHKFMEQTVAVSTK